LAIDRAEDDRENGGDCRGLANVQVRVEVHPSVAQLGNNVDAGLTFGHGEASAVEILEAVGKRLELFRVLDQRLHFFLAPHRAKMSKRTLDGRRKRGSRVNVRHARNLIRFDQRFR
jgi:hypothetical protein